MSADVIANTSSTLDPPQGVPLYIRKDGSGYLVTDVVGLRYGWGRTLRSALKMWAQEVQWFLDEPSERLAGSALAEKKKYVEALKAAAAPSGDDSGREAGR